MIVRILLLAFLAWLVYRLVVGYGRSVGRGQARPVAQAEEEDMVRCAQCGVHLPKSEAILARGDFYCCDEHRRLRQG